MSELLSIEGVSVAKKGRGGGSILGTVDLVLREGDLAVVFGPSGSGKSTLLNVVAGFLRRHRCSESASQQGDCIVPGFSLTGHIRILGHHACAVPVRNRPVGLVMQEHNLYPHLSVAENLGLPLRIAGVPGALRVEKVRAMALRLELTDEIEKLPDELSGGQRQRVAIGKMLLRDPDVALFDEAFSQLDPCLRRNFRQTVFREVVGEDRGPSRPRRCAVVVSHDVFDAVAASCIVVLGDDGAPPTAVFRSSKWSGAGADIAPSRQQELTAWEQFIQSDLREARAARENANEARVG